MHYARLGIAVDGSKGRNVFGNRSNFNEEKKTLQSNAVKNAQGTNGADSVRARERMQQTEKYLINGYYFGSCRYANGFGKRKQNFTRKIFEFLHNAISLPMRTSPTSTYSSIRSSSSSSPLSLRILMTVVYASLLIHLML